MATILRCVEGIFSPVQLEHIADLSTEKQRLWRHRKILRPQARGRAQFTARELAGIVALRYLEISPGGDLKALAVHANRVALFVLGFALADPNAWIMQSFMEHKEAFASFLKAKVDREGLCSVARSLGLAKEDFGRFYISALLEWTVADDLPLAFKSLNRPASLVIDLQAMSHLLVASVVKHSDTPLFWVVDEAFDESLQVSARWKNVVMRIAKSRESIHRRARG